MQTIKNANFYSFQKRFYISHLCFIFVIFRLIKTLFKDVLISLHKPTLSIDKILTIHYGREENDEVEIEYKDLQVNDYQVSLMNDDILIGITKELIPDYVYHVLVRTKQQDGTEEDFDIHFIARGNAAKNLWLYSTLEYTYNYFISPSIIGFENLFEHPNQSNQVFNRVCRTFLIEFSQVE